MQRITVYATSPVGPQLACVFLGLARRQFQVVLRPVAELPAAAHPHPERAQLRQQLEHHCQRLAEIGAALEAVVTGQRRPAAGEEQELLLERQAVQQRVQALKQTLRTPAPAPASG